MDRNEELRDLAQRIEEIVARADLFLDTETTDRDGSEVVEIGIVDRNGNALLSALVRPKGIITPEATAVHGITQADVACAATWLDLWPAVRAILQGRNVACYNAAFDFGALRNSCKAYPSLRWHNVELPGVAASWHDVMEPFAIWYGEWDNYHDNYHWQKLSTAVRCAHLAEAANSHRAIEDAEACRQVLLWLHETLQRRPE